jgi:DNA-binding transcriptional ArsR family regulator
MPADQVRILRTDQEAMLLFDDMRREILRLLAKQNLTPHKLSTMLGLSAPTVGHHLSALGRSGLVRIVGREPETHGIMQTFYSATAQAYIIETGKLSPAVRRYFMPARIERTRGMLAALSLHSTGGFELSSELVEETTEELAGGILESAEHHPGPRLKMDPETVINEIYSDALSNLIRKKPRTFSRLSVDVSPRSRLDQ